MSANVFRKYSLLCGLLINRTVIIPGAKRTICSRTALRNFARMGRRGAHFFSPIHARTHAYSTIASPEVTFDNERVQELLKRMTGRDFDKIFAVRVEELEVPKYQLMSDEQLQEARKEMDEVADTLLKMPPQPAEREERGQSISRDEKLEDFDECCYVFTDISTGLDNESRHIVVRETNGTLRHARWSERDRINLIYFPVKDRQIVFPSLLKDENLPRVFDQLRHANVLDLVCIQCPPDSPDYIRVHKRAHADLLWRENYDLLYSTRHYGPYLWFLSSKHQLEGVLKYFLTMENEANAIDIVQLHHLMFPKMSSALECTRLNITGLPIVKSYSQSMNYDSIVELLEKRSEEEGYDKDTNTDEQNKQSTTTP